MILIWAYSIIAATSFAIELKKVVTIENKSHMALEVFCALMVSVLWPVSLAIGIAAGILSARGE